MPNNASLISKLTASILVILYIAGYSIIYFPITVFNSVCDGLEYVWTGNMPKGIQ
jgi:hypothetical protein